MEPSNLQNVEGNGKNIAPEPMNPEASQVIPNSIRLSAYDAIFKALWQIDVLKENPCRSERLSKDELVHHLQNPTLSDPLEPNGLYYLYREIMIHLPLNTLFEYEEVERKTCNRCKTPTESQHTYYGHLVYANSLLEIKSAFRNFTFENVLKVIMMSRFLVCDNEACQKPNYAETMIEELPSVYAIALKWEYNETEMEIKDTIYVLETRVNITEIYKCEGDCPFVNYQLTSMVCMCGDQYICISYENSRWIRHVDSEKQFIGDDLMSIVDTFASEHFRPMILFYEQDVGEGLRANDL